MDAKRIYLDYAASTPLDPAVAEAMRPYASERFGNPSSIHREGQAARRAVDEARETVAGVLACRPREIVFTSSATSADNLVVRCAVFAPSSAPVSKPHIVISAIEHPAVLRPAALLAQYGAAEVTEVRPRPDGVVNVDDVLSAVRPETALVSVMLANSEIGTIQPVRDIASAIRRTAGARPLIHTDAVQGAAWLDVRPEKLGVDLLTLSAHKVYGPKGMGVLYVRDGVVLAPLVCGGGQERGLFSGTENVAAIVGGAAAFRISRERRDTEVPRVQALRDRLLDRLLQLPFVTLTGSRERRLPNNIHLTLEGVSADLAVIALDREGIAASTGSACSSGSAEPSGVLLALGYSRERARSGLRFTLGYPTTEDDIARAKETITAVLQRLYSAARAV